MLLIVERELSVSKLFMYIYNWSHFPERVSGLDYKDAAVIRFGHSDVVLDLPIWTLVLHLIAFLSNFSNFSLLSKYHQFGLWSIVADDWQAARFDVFLFFSENRIKIIWFNYVNWNSVRGNPIDFIKFGSISPYSRREKICHWPNILPGQGTIPIFSFLFKLQKLTEATILNPHSILKTIRYLLK